MSNSALVAAMKGSRLATELTDEQIALLSDHVSFRDLRAGEVLVSEGTADNHLYVIVNGNLGVVRAWGTPEAVTLFTLGPRDLVGELSFIDATPHYASIVALNTVHAFGLEREKLEALLHEHPELVYRVMRAIVRTVHEIQRRLSMQSTELTNYIYKQHGRY